jgi:hypothetical protein
MIQGVLRNIPHHKFSKTRKNPFCHLQTFSEEWARLNREVVEEAGQLGHALVWMRSGHIEILLI